MWAKTASATPLIKKYACCCHARGQTHKQNY